eukprot:6263227-Pyramimonas_sp.AAC.1
MIPRPPKSPTFSEVPAGMCRAVSATGFASVAPNYLASAREHARASAAAEKHQSTPSTHRSRSRM